MMKSNTKISLKILKKMKQLEKKTVNIYRDSTITGDEGEPQRSLAEMLEALHISQDTTGVEGDLMMT